MSKTPIFMHTPDGKETQVANNPSECNRLHHHFKQHLNSLCFFVKTSHLILHYIQKGIHFHTWQPLSTSKWKSLPDERRQTPTINSFKRKLKTYLFTSAFS